ncbi:MAG: L-threonylcarbamoyladenylate synthase [Planctomycetota bacterium]
MDPLISSARCRILAADAEGVAKAAEAIREGLLVGLPTETVYGLAARGDDERAAARIFAAKGRPESNPLILHVADMASARSCFTDQWDAMTQRRFERAGKLWPGPLTLVGPKHERIPAIVTAGQDTVAVRIPDHRVAQMVLSLAGVPVAAPSANVSNYVSPTTAAHVVEGLGDHVDWVIDGGPCSVGIESTIMTLGDDHTSPMILRAGGLDVATLEKQLGEVVSVVQKSIETGKTPVTPGQFAKHYSPRKPLRIVDPRSIKRPPFGDHESSEVFAGAARWLRIRCLPSPVIPEGYDAVWTIASSGKLSEVAAGLYAVLRRADAGPFDAIDIESVDETGLGVAIMDRLRRAAHQSR